MWAEGRCQAQGHGQGAFFFFPEMALFLGSVTDTRLRTSRTWPPRGLDPRSLFP